MRWRGLDTITLKKSEERNANAELFPKMRKCLRAGDDAFSGEYLQISNASTVEPVYLCHSNV